MNIHARLIALSLSLFLVLQACGGGSQLAEGGIGGTGISTGTVTGFGSVLVNGVWFDTDNAVFLKDGSAAIQDDLEKGMVLTVEGTINPDGTGVATKVSYADILEGPISGPPTASSFIAMGQTVIVDTLTLYKNVSGIAGLAAGDVVEVSGFVDQAGNIRATYIEKTTSPVHEIKGLVTAVGTNQFNIGALVVNWTGSAVSQGSFVEAKGQMNGSGQLQASQVETITVGFGIDDADDAELEGLALGPCLPVPPAPTLPCEFAMGVQTVRVLASTEMDGGTVADIQPNIRLEAEGELVSGVLVADKVEFEDDIELESGIASVIEDPVAGTKTLTLDGLAGISVVINEFSTEFDGIAYADIDDTDYLRIRARDAGSNQVEATRVEPGSSSEVKLQGPVQSFVTNVSLTILGVTIDTTATGFNFETEEGTPMTSAQFYTALQIGTIVETKGQWNSSAVNWESAELDD